MAYGVHQGAKHQCNREEGSIPQPSLFAMLCCIACRRLFSLLCCGRHQLCHSSFLTLHPTPSVKQTDATAIASQDKRRATAVHWDDLGIAVHGANARILGPLPGAEPHTGREHPQSWDPVWPECDFERSTPRRQWQFNPRQKLRRWTRGGSQ